MAIWSHSELQLFPTTPHIWSLLIPQSQIRHAKIGNIRSLERINIQKDRYKIVLSHLVDTKSRLTILIPDNYNQVKFLRLTIPVEVKMHKLHIFWYFHLNSCMWACLQFPWWQAIYYHVCVNEIKQHRKIYQRSLHQCYCYYSNCQKGMRMGIKQMASKPPHSEISFKGPNQQTYHFNQ